MINNKQIKQNIIYSLGILAILTLGVIIVPTHVNANENIYGGNGSSTWCSNCSIQNSNQYEKPPNNPKPVVDSINPDYSNLGEGAKTITITGSGFVPSSVVRLDGSNRPTTFIDYSHLLVNLFANDLYGASGRYITVFNPSPGGGYSNAAFFTINGYIAPNTEITSDTSTINSNDGTINNNDFSNLASNAIFGSNSFLPSGLIQWTLFAIVILLIVILVRKTSGAEKSYHETPLKHA